MKVLVAGATGFTGSRVVRRLLDAGHEARCLVRATSDRRRLAGLPVDTVVGDLSRAESVVRALRGVEALAYVASLGFGHGPGVVRACERAGVERALFFGTTAVFTTLPSASRAVRLAAEDAIRESGLAWTIFRPTMIYGAPGDRNVERLLAHFRRHRVLPLSGRGVALVQPVLVDDLADAVAAALPEARAVRRAYCLPGRAPVPFRRLCRLAAEAVGRRPLLVPLPTLVLLALARTLASRWVRAEQIERLMEDKDFEWAAARRDFGYDPTPVPEGLRLAARRTEEGERI